MEIQPPGSTPPPGLSDDSVHKIFFNQRGLRPGWRFLIAVALYGLFELIAGFLILQFAPQLLQGLTPGVFIPRGIIELLIVIFVTWIMSRIERRNMGEFGLPLRSSRPLYRFVYGYIFWGFLPLTLLLLVMRALHVFYFGNFALRGSHIFFWAAIWGVVFILVGLTEEYSIRGYLLYTLAEGVGFWPAAVMLAALFGVLHTFNRGETRIGIIMTTLWAMFAVVTLRYTGSLWLAVGAHAGWDWGQSYFYGVPDSGLVVAGHLLNPETQGPAWLNGGTVGPEGSFLTLVLLVTMSVLFVLLYRRSREPALVVTRNL